MPLLIRVKHCFETGLVFLEGGLGLMLYVLKLFRLFQQILSGLVVSVAYWTIWVVGSNPTVFRINFFFFQIEET